MGERASFKSDYIQLNDLEYCCGKETVVSESLELTQKIEPDQIIPLAQPSFGRSDLCTSCSNQMWAHKNWINTPCALAMGVDGDKWTPELIEYWESWGTLRFCSGFNPRSLAAEAAYQFELS